MKKKTGCLIVLTIVAAFLIGGLTVTGLIFTLLTGHATVKPPDNLSPAAAKFQSYPFYRNAGGWDYSRLGLIKPYELFAPGRLLENPFLINMGIPKTNFKNQISIVRRFNIFKNYFIACIDVCGNSSLMYCYWVLDLNKKKYSDFDIYIDYDPQNKLNKIKGANYIITFSYGKKQNNEEFKDKSGFLSRARLIGFSEGKIINRHIRVDIPEEYCNCVFFSEDELKAGLKARDIPEDIKIFEPKYFYQKFLDEGQCPWFPQADGK